MLFNTGSLCFYLQQFDNSTYLCPTLQKPTKCFRTLEKEKQVNQQQQQQYKRNQENLHDYSMSIRFPNQLNSKHLWTDGNLEILNVWDLFVVYCCNGWTPRSVHESYKTNRIEQQNIKQMIQIRWFRPGSTNTRTTIH